MRSWLVSFPARDAAAQVIARAAFLGLADSRSSSLQNTHLGSLARGFICDEAKLVVVTDAEIFGRYKVQRPRRLKSPHAGKDRTSATTSLPLSGPQPRSWRRLIAEMAGVRFIRCHREYADTLRPAIRWLQVSSDAENADKFDSLSLGMPCQVDGVPPFNWAKEPRFVRFDGGTP